MIAQSTHKHAIGKHILFFPHVQYIFVFYFHDAHDVIIIHEKCSYSFFEWMQELLQVHTPRLQREEAGATAS
jgi:hypothetical protein